MKTGASSDATWPRKRVCFHRVCAFAAEFLIAPSRNFRRFCLPGCEVFCFLWVVNIPWALAFLVLFVEAVAVLVVMSEKRLWFADPVVSGEGAPLSLMPAFIAVRFPFEFLRVDFLVLSCSLVEVWVPFSTGPSLAGGSRAQG